MISVTLTLLGLTTAHAADDVAPALRAVTPPAAALAVADAYPGGNLSAGFRNKLADWTRNTLAASAQRYLDAARVSCETQANVSFLDAGTFGTTSEEKDFEGSTFLVESVYCLDSGTAAQTIDIYTSSDFRINVMPMVDSFSITGDQMCLSTEPKAGLLKPTSFCHQIVPFKGPTSWGMAGWLVSNDPRPEIQPLYFRETVVLFVDRPDGGVAGYRGVVTRSRDLGTLQRTVLRTIVGAGHSKVEAGLKDRLASTP